MDLQELKKALSWSLRSPGLLQGPQMVDDVWCRHQWQALRHDVARLRGERRETDHLLRAQKGRLGHFFEMLVQTWLRWSPQIHRLRHNLAIHHEGRTLGELDLLFYDSARRASCHWEVAVKFYLLHEGEYIGPDPSDRLERKIQRLLHHQLPLSESAEATELLRDYPPPLRREALVKGRLFYGAEDYRTPPSISNTISPHHLRGWWIRQRDALPEFHGHSRWRLLSRPQWLASQNGVAGESHSRETMQQRIRQHFLHSQRPLMLAEVLGQNHASHEVSRGMVVSDDWPGIPE